jgi:2-polyprenyl-6-methoxyphenol hydroxylase-like FAD-dependent oxidoreductase
MGWVTDGLFGLFAQTDGRIQTLRNWGMSGIDRLSPVKQWLTRQAMGTIA